MICGCAEVDFKSKLLIFDNKINSFAYRIILDKSGIFNQLNNIKGIYNCYFQQDDAAFHV